MVNVWTNFQDYGLPPPLGLLRFDLHTHPFRHAVSQGWPSVHFTSLRAGVWGPAASLLLGQSGCDRAVSRQRARRCTATAKHSSATQSEVGVICCQPAFLPALQG